MEPRDGPSREIIHRGNLARWAFIGVVLSTLSGSFVFNLVHDAGETFAQALLAAGGSAVGVATLYVAVSAFINSVRAP
jgi:hypothetical protein